MKTTYAVAVIDGGAEEIYQKAIQRLEERSCTLQPYAGTQQ
jgi:hypothetical protein